MDDHRVNSSPAFDETTRHRAGAVACGFVLAQSCGLTSVAVVLGYLFDRREATVREQVRD